ncbi:Peptidoglycan/LPS O-acetylase OafA/YrhL, contains acyltransferase and SGNH-hydrolase domains [Curtobacterium sp. UNCCL20]|uniref:SGNH hydrolase domain-containing protein n=1 Tax=Curtobacterium sp. UNCCL20 TaxID=1502773 RepID=UPI00088EE09B|nr:SGNH hydrolase domain-containing protein [Curtobacterium sp. UNCCL20]SDQ43674.1 Peptidoglycan/LPS O-acetylase OafA/YrhL, contains acyltransferase and SGNH-hydrolase domains [Curtobacterium sp. UNCCL20]
MTSTDTVVDARHDAQTTHSTTTTRAPAGESQYLPAPPTDREKYWYMGPQHRWMLFAQAAAFALIASSIWRFSTSAPGLLLFLIPTTLYCLTLCVSLVTSSRRKRFRKRDHIERVQQWQPDRYPTVDVFLPTAGEPIRVLENTYYWVSKLRWPTTLTVYVLDDGDRPEVAELARRYGYRYEVRPDRGHLKKAGNLRHGYERSDGDLIAVFDADFVPRADYLHELVPYFDDQGLGIVQSPQFFDARKGMHWLQRTAGATQELFYRWIQPARDRSNAAICVGTCAIYRRAALEQAGGFAQIGHSEDVHTGVNLMRVGFLVRYVPILVSKGMCPDDLASFLNQQYRWCTGSMSLLADTTFHENPHITLRQRMCFWSGFLYYMSTAVNVFLSPLPGLVMLFGLPQWIMPQNSVWLLGAMVMWLVVVPIMYKSRWRIDVLRIQSLYSFAHAVAIVHVLTGRTKEWVPTGAAKKVTTPLGTQIARVMRITVTASLLVTWSGLAWATVRYGLDMLWAMWVLAAIHAYVQVPMLFLSVPSSPRRAARRAARADRREARLTARRPAGAVHGAAPTPALAAIAAADVADPALPAPPLSPAVTPSSPVGTLPEPSRASRPEQPAFGERLDPVALPATAAPVEEPVQAERPQAVGPRVFRPDIQGLRAVAVLLVVIYHTGAPVITGGYVGVDVFFAISGFLITGQLLREVERKGRVDFGAFYAGRIRRLLPTALLVIAVTVVATRLFDSILRASSVAWDGVAATFFSLNYRLAAQGVDYQAADGPASPLEHFWSLGVEEQFYLLWPLVLTLAIVLWKRHRRLAMAAVVTLVFGVSMWASVTITAHDSPLAYFSMQTRAWELAAGAFLAIGARYVTRIPGALQIGLTWLGLGAILASAFLYSDETPFPGTAALLPVLGACAVIAGGGVYRRGSVESLLGRKLFQAIGKVSYGWYLWHWPMVVLVPVMVNRDLGWLEKLEVMAVALWVATITYHLIESPSARARWKRIRWAAVGAAAAAVTTATAVVVVFSVPALVGSGGTVQAASLDQGNTKEIQTTIQSALAERDVPANLTPSLTDAADDQPDSTDNGCHAGYLQIQQKACVYGDPDGARTVVLWGDSHAQQWLPAFDAAGKSEGWKVVAWTKAACPVAQQVELFNSSLKRTYTECPEWRDASMQRIQALDPDLVVMAQSDNVPGKQVSNTTWADGTAETAATMQAAGLKTVYMLDTPVPEGDAVSCVAEHLDTVEECNQAEQHAYAVSGRHQDVADTVRAAGVSTVEPRDWFCTDDGCPVVVQDKLVYRDQTHMSTAYSRWLEPLVAPLLRSS